MVPFFKMEWAAGAAAGLGNNVDIPSNGSNIGLEVTRLTTMYICGGHLIQDPRGRW